MGIYTQLAKFDKLQKSPWPDKENVQQLKKQLIFQKIYWVYWF